LYHDNAVQTAFQMKSLVAVLIVFCSCANGGSDPMVHRDTANALQPANTPEINEVKNVYGIRLDSNVLYLQQWDSTVNLQKLLGKPIKQKTTELDLNSDTHAGSFTRKLEYDGLRINLFSPKGNGRTFWIQEIILTGDRFKTVNGIGIGSTFQEVKTAYPLLKKFPGENENMYYLADAGYEKSIEMEFEKDILKKLRLYYMIN
jgi:hypothetical protein